MRCQMLDTGNALELLSQIVMPAGQLQADDFLLIDAMFEAFGCIEGDDFAGIDNADSV
jgi:hypothetical protein